MDETEYAIVQLAQEAEKLMDRTKSQATKELLAEAARLLITAASQHHNEV